MLIEVGPRTIGKCDLKYSECTGKTVSIVKKVFLATDGVSAWACQSCLLHKVKSDRIAVAKHPNPTKELA